MIHKNGLDQFRGLDAGKAREEQKRTIRQAS